MKRTSAVVLAAGKGTRMKTETPKVLHEVGGRPMLERVISSLENAGIEDIIVVVGYKAGMIEKKFASRARFVKQKELLGSGDALRSALPLIDGDKGTVIVTCGDAPLIRPETFSGLVSLKDDRQADCVLLTSRVSDPFGYGRIIRGEEGDPERIIEEKDAEGAQKEIDEINAGTYCFSLAPLKEYIDTIELNPLKKEYYLTDIIAIFSEKGKKITAETCAEEEIVGINTRKDIAAVNNVIKDRKLRELMESGVTIVDPGTTYIDESAGVGRDTVIYPCTVIEKDVEVGENCRIGPFARLRPGTVLDEGVEIGNYVELCRSRIGSGTKVKHHTYLGDTVVGKDANIGAGTITANYDGKRKHRTEIADRAFIGIGVSLVAPIKIGEAAKVGAGSVVTRNKDVPPGVTVAGVPAKPLKNAKGE